MDDIEHTLKEVEQLQEVPNQFLNQDQAQEFINSCSDPIVRNFLWEAFATLTFRMAPHGPDGQFDVLFFTRIIATMLNDRDRLRQMLSEELSEESKDSKGDAVL
jgi:hypothetical protein